MEIKKYPEDFIVEEIGTEINYSLYQKLKDLLPKKKKKYVICTLVKKNWTTLRAVKKIAKALHISQKRIGFAGNKDKKAVTSQRISIYNVDISKIKKLRIKDIILKNFSYSDKEIKLGDLKGNRFKILVRGINSSEKNEIKKRLFLIQKNGIPNEFGEQRFSKNNFKIGELILKQKFKEAVKLLVGGEDYKNLIKDAGDVEKVVLSHLIKFPNDYVGAIKKLPKRLYKLYVYSYQSKLFNDLIKILWSKGIKRQMSLPLVGYSVDNSIYETYNLLDKDINFKVKSFPEASLKGGYRDYLMFPKKVKFKFLNNNLMLKFVLDKGQYATTLINYLFKQTF